MISRCFRYRFIIGGIIVILSSSLVASAKSKRKPPRKTVQLKKAGAKRVAKKTRKGKVGSAPVARVVKRSDAQQKTPASGPTRALNRILPPPVSYSADIIRARAQGRVFQLTTTVRGGQGKQSYGTAFVVGTAGILATNFHVVSTHVNAPDRYSLEIQTPQGSLPAEVIDFDVANDLALIRVKQVFETSYNFAQVAPNPGEKIYSIGLPEDTVMTIIEALFSDVQRNGPVEKFVMSAPLNHGMSGGPAVNSHDEIVGVNDAILGDAQNISFFVPSSKVVALLLHASMMVPNRDPASLPSVPQQIQAQVQGALHPWLESWKSRVESSPPLAFGGAMLGEAPPNSKCWEDVMKGSGLSQEAQVRICHGGDNFPLTGENSGGTIDLSYARPTSTRGLGNSVFGISALRAVFLAQSQLRYQSSTGSSEHSGKYVCSHRLIENKRGVRLMTQYCATNIKPLPGLFDIEVTATALNVEPAVVGQMLIGGFPQAEALLATEAFLNGFGKNTPAEAPR